MDDVQAQLPTGRVAGGSTLEFAVAQAGRSTIDGQQVPLETETTAALAYTLAESPVWQREIGGFLQRMGAIDKGTQLASLMPYRPGRIPVVLVHGTASSPGRWAQMMNELGNDPRIGPRVQAWLFTYDTGNPIGYSAMLLRESLKSCGRAARPGGQGPGAARHGRDRPQPGRAAHQDDRDRQRRSLLAPRQQHPFDDARSRPRAARDHAQDGLRRARAERQTRGVPFDAAPRQLHRRQLARAPGGPADQSARGRDPARRGPRHAEPRAS